LCCWLRSIYISQAQAESYANQLIEIGYDCLETLGTIDPNELDKMADTKTGAPSVFPFLTTKMNVCIYIVCVCVLPFLFNPLVELVLTHSHQTSSGHMTMIKKHLPSLAILASISREDCAWQWDDGIWDYDDDSDRSVCFHDIDQQWCLD
jgi:hypothetical protein